MVLFRGLLRLVDYMSDFACVLCLHSHITVSIHLRLSVDYYRALELSQVIAVDSNEHYFSQCSAELVQHIRLRKFQTWHCLHGIHTLLPCTSLLESSCEIKTKRGSFSKTARIISLIFADPCEVFVVPVCSLAPAH